jgi:hypothetical protein
MSASSGKKLTDGADIAKQEPKFVKKLTDVCVIGKICLALSAASLNKTYRCLRHR